MQREIRSIDDPNSLLTLSVPEMNVSHLEQKFDGGEIRRILYRNYDPECRYFFLKTVANPKAILELSENKLIYGNRLLDRYLIGLKNLSDIELDNDVHDYIGTLKTEGSETNVYFQGNIPQIHIIKGWKGAERFLSLVEMLNEDLTYEFLKKSEAPNNKNMNEIDYLRNNDIAPLIHHGKEVVMKGEKLKTFLEVLVPYTLSISYKQNFPVDE